jgi:hypothetical protein
MQTNHDMALRRIQPRLGPEHFRTYTITAPIATHWRKASCEEYECDEFLNGFVLTIDTTTELGQRQLHYVRHDRSRNGSVQNVGPGVVKVFYPPGTMCWEPIKSTHRVPIGRPPYFLVHGGDWRGDPRGIGRLVHRRPSDWVEDFALNQIAIADTVRKGTL